MKRARGKRGTKVPLGGGHRAGKAGAQSAAQKGAPTGAHATIHEIARIAGVSATTVSRVLNQTQSGNYAAATALRVRNVAEQIGFRWNQSARSLRTRRSERLQIIAPNWHDILLSEYQMQLFQGIADEAQQRGYEVTLSLIPFPQWISGEGILRAVRRSDVDGHLIAPSHFETAIPRDTRPVVLCGLRPLPRNKHLLYVDCDNVSGAMQATQLLLDAGRRRIAHFAGFALSSSAAERRQGYETVMRDAGREPLVRTCGFSEQDGYDAAQVLCDELRGVDAIFAANDLSALGALRALTERGRRVPADVALVGFDGISAGQLIRPTLTTVVQPVTDVGRESVKILCEKISGERPVRREHFVPVTLRRGGSA